MSDVLQALPNKPPRAEREIAMGDMDIQIHVVGVHPSVVGHAGLPWSLALTGKVLCAGYAVLAAAVYNPEDDRPFSYMAGVHRLNQRLSGVLNERTEDVSPLVQVQQLAGPGDAGLSAAEQAAWLRNQMGILRHDEALFAWWSGTVHVLPSAAL